MRVHEIARDLAWCRALAEDPVDAELGRGRRIEARPAGDQRTVAVPVAERGVDRGRHLAHVLEMRVALRDHLADEHGVRALGAGASRQHVCVDLRAEVDHLDLPVGLEALLARKPFDRKDRVEPDGVRVRADRCADDDQPAAQTRPDREVDLFRGEQRELPLPHLDLVAGRRDG